MEAYKESIVTLYCCPYGTCGREYKSRFNLRRHVLYYHVGNKPFVCSICEKSFVSKQNMIEHQFIHSGTKPYKCTSCGAKFRQISLLSLHKRTHQSNYQDTLKIAIELQELE